MKFTIRFYCALGVSAALLAFLPLSFSLSLSLSLVDLRFGRLFLPYILNQIFV